MARVFLSIGSNMDDRAANIQHAVGLLNMSDKIKVVKTSSFYETEPWGFKSDNSFLNAALCVETSLEPVAILHIIKEIEVEMGRTQKSAAGSLPVTCAAMVEEATI